MRSPSPAGPRPPACAPRAAQWLLPLPGGGPRISVAGVPVPAGPPPALPPEEAALLSPGATPRRRAEFFAGREAARAAVRGLLPGAHGVRVLRAEGPCAGRPLVLLDGVPAAVDISISHADGLALAAASRGVALGIDLCAVEARGPAFHAEAFSEGELARWARYLGGDEALVESVAFAAKEAVLKWLGCGLRAPLRSVCVAPLGGPGRPYRAGDRSPLFVVARRGRAGAVLSGWLSIAGARAGVVLGGPRLAPREAMP